MNIKLGIVLYRILSRAYFYLPFLLIYLYKSNYSLIQIEFIMSLYGIGAFISGRLLNIKIRNLSSKKLLILSELLKVLGLVGLIFNKLFPMICISQMILGISYSIGAGEDTKLINNLADNDTFQSKTNSYMFLSLLISGIIGSFLFNFSLHLPIIVTALASLVCISSLLILIPETKQSETFNTNKNIAKTLEIGEVGWILHYSFIRGIILSLFTGFLPFYFFVNLAIPTETFIFILGAYTITGMLSSKYLTNLPVISSEITLILALWLLLYQNRFIIVLAMIFLGISSGLTRPQTIRYLTPYQNLSSDLKRAEFLYSILNFGFLIMGGLIYEFYGYPFVIFLALSLFIFYFILQFYLWRFKHAN